MFCLTGTNIINSLRQRIPTTEFNLLPRTLRGRRHVQFDSTSTQFLSLREKRGKHRIPKDIKSLGGSLPIWRFFGEVDEAAEPPDCSSESIKKKLYEN